MKNKFMICLSSLLCAASFLTACGGSDSSESVAESKSASSEESYEITAPSLDLSKPGSTISIKAPTIPTRFTAPAKKSQAIQSRRFVLNETSISMRLEPEWKIASGGENADSAICNITSYPAVLQYKDTKNTITIVLADGCEDQEAFLANTEESYIEAYGGEFESINITDFEQLTIQRYDSFKVVADVVIGGEEYQMTNIITNDISGKTLTVMALDSDGSLKDLDIKEQLQYPVNTKSLKELRDKKIPEARYRWDNDLKKSVPIE